MSEEKGKVISKQVNINGEAVTLYSLNGITWLSKADDLQSTMDRLENHRITLNDPKAEGGEKKVKERFKPRGPRGAPPTVEKTVAGEVDDDIVLDEIDDIDDDAEPIEAADDQDENDHLDAAQAPAGKIIKLPTPKGKPELAEIAKPTSSKTGKVISTPQAAPAKKVAVAAPKSKAPAKAAAPKAAAKKAKAKPVKKAVSAKKKK